MWLTYGVLAVSTTLLMTLHLVHGQVPELTEVPQLTPSSNQTVPNNGAENITYNCTIPMTPGLELLWEVDNRQITPDIVDSFEDRGIFIQSGPSERESTLIFTPQALVNDVYMVQCLGVTATLDTVLSPTFFINLFGPTDPPTNLNVAPLNDSFLLITWDRPSTLPEVTLTYVITVTNISAIPPTTPQNFMTPETFLEYEELETDCHEFLFEVSAINDAGSSQPANITESIPISPDLSLTDASLTILYVNVSSSTATEIAVSFNRATSCNERFRVASHRVLVIGEGGEVVRSEMTESTQDLLQVTVGAIPRDTAYTVAVEACNILLCRRSISLDLLTTDVQTAAALFFETFISINCTYGTGSVARGCVVTLQLEEGDGGEGREVFRLEREKGTSEVSVQCNQTENSRMAYQVISAADWESDGTVGSFSIPVATNVTEVEDNFPCPTDDGGGSDRGLSGGAIAGIVVGTTVFVILVTLAIVFVVFIWYYRTRPIKKKSNGAISIDERALLSSADRRDVPPLSSLPVTVTARADSPAAAYESGTMKSSSSMPAHTLQSSLDCGPVGEISIPKEGKIHMKIWSDTLDRCKRTGKKAFQLLPLLDDMETQPEPQPTPL